MMQALRGFDASIFGWNSAPGRPECPGLKEVYFVRPSHLWEPVPGDIDPALLNFRAPPTKGITNGQKNLRGWAMHEINRVENDVGLRNVG